MSLLELHSIGALCTTTATKNVQQIIINTMFNQLIDDTEYQQIAIGVDVYFKDWYEEECGNCERQVSIGTDAELMRIVAYLSDVSETRASIRQKLRDTRPATQPDPPKDAELDASITLAARLLLMIPVGDFGLSLPAGRPIPWADGTVKEVVDELFAPVTGPHDPVRLPKVFNALNLGRIAGIKISWTSNLADHLLMNDDEGTVTLFHHITFLKLHQGSDWYVSIL